MEEYWYWICGLEGIYRCTMERLITHFKNPMNLYNASSQEVENLTFLSVKQRQVLLKSRYCQTVYEEYHNRKNTGIEFISMEHPDYPWKLKEIPDPPFGLYYKGHLPDDTRTSIGIVGARQCSGYGRRMAELLAEQMVNCGVQVISGLAAGIDGFSQASAVKAGGSSFGVLGCGADICYPKKHQALYTSIQQNGGILTEYPPHTQPLALHFPMRNRIISGLSDALIVVEAKERSGSLITADFALDQGKDVFAVPGRMEEELSRGCNRLIAQGAGIIYGAEELLEELHLTRGKRAKNKKNNIILETKEKLVYSCVDFKSKSLQTILQETKLPLQDIMAALVALELKGVIRETAKNFYAKIK